MMIIDNMVFAAILYVLSLALFVYYLYKKYKLEKYIFSVCNAFVFQYAVSLFIIPPFMFTPIAWVKLLGDSAYSNAAFYYPYLLKSLELNCIGFSIFILALMKFEFSKKIPKYIYKKTLVAEKYTIESLLNIEFIIIIAVWLIYSIAIVGGFNLFGETSNSDNGIFHFVNQAVQIIIVMLTLYYGFSFVNRRKNLCFFIIGLVACILMGKRSTLVMDVLWSVILYVLYRKTNFSKKVVKKAIKYVIVLVVIGIIIGNVRASSKDFTILQSVLYGNTFCDIRDGGMILYAFENNTQSELAMGRTYLSALLSFVPSSLSSLRLQWDWGRYSTSRLLGWRNHPGLRGGWVMESYLNFGFVGSIFFMIITARVLASIEKYFRMEMFETGNKEIHEKSMLVLYAFITLYRRFTCSAGFFAVYVIVLFILFNNTIGRSIKRA